MTLLFALIGCLVLTGGVAVSLHALREVTR